MIETAIGEALDAISSRFWGMFDFVTDPFWGWLMIGVIIVAAVAVICYFFGSFFPILRPIGGVILMLVTMGLYSYRKGERDAQARDAARRSGRRRPPDD